MAKSLTPNFLFKFLEKAPAALSLVRAIEADLFNQTSLDSPVLDIGCGDGLFSSIAFSKPIDVGIDLDLKELNYAKNTAAYTNLVQSNAANLPFRDHSFQTVVSNCVFEHIEYFEQAFSEIYRVLKPGGKYAFTAHSHNYNDFLFWPSVFKNLGFPVPGNLYCQFINHMFRHFNCFTPENWVRLLKNAGFSDFEWKYYLTRATLRRFDLILPTTGFSYLSKKLFGKWVILPRGLRRYFFQRYLSNLCANQNGDGAAIFIIAKKI